MFKEVLLISAVLLTVLMGCGKPSGNGQDEAIVSGCDEFVDNNQDTTPGRGDNEDPDTLVILLSESFDDGRLNDRGWYDGTAVRISNDSFLGSGCIEYEWIRGVQGVQGSSVNRYLFTPVNELYIRFYLRLSKNWEWTSVNYHPHLLHFMTTENSKYHGPASSHLTLYVEPVNGKLRLAATDMQNQRYRNCK